MKRTIQNRGGFTLVELMVAVFVGSIVIWGIYTIYEGSSRIFHEEHRISQAQLSARLAMEVIKNDLKRAGFMATPNVNFDPMVCQNVGGAGLVNVQSIVHVDGTAGSVYSQAGAAVNIYRPDINAGIAPDALTLAGNYITTQSFLAQVIRASAGQIQLQSIQRLTLPGEDPTIPPPLPTDNDFARMFPLNSYIRVVNPYGFMMFSRVQSVGSSATRTLTVNPPLPDASSVSVMCGVHGYGEGSEVNVVNMVLYRIEVDPNDATGKKTDLVRWQVDANGATVAGTREIIAEYAVDFQVWFRVDDIGTALMPQQPSIQQTVDVPQDNVVVLVAGGGPQPPLDGTVAAHPEDMRVAIVRLSIRTAEEDPTFPFIARAAGEPLVRYDLEAGAVGAAHVRTIVAQVELPNIAFRNLRN